LASKPETKLNAHKHKKKNFQVPKPGTKLNAKKKAFLVPITAVAMIT